MFKTITSKVSFSELEETVLAFWEKEEIFKKSLSNRKDGKIFFFYDGPPFATGLPHYGHMLAGTIKDVIPRYKTMTGHYVERRFGWDCHGLPVEFEAEKELKLKGKVDIEKLGIANFNEYCRSIVLRYTKEWRYLVSRMGRWADLENDYKTMDTDFMETIWWVFDNLYRKGLIYLSNKIVAYSPRLSTPISNFEVNLGYRMTTDPSVTIKFKVQGEDSTYLLAWTTTPWTLISNASLTVGKDLDYSLVQIEDEKYYLATSSLKRVLANYDYQEIKQVKGASLEYLSYCPLFPYFEDLAKKDGDNDSNSNNNKGAFFVTLGNYVDTETGTGIVHTAPFFGEDDFNTGKVYSLPLMMPFDDAGFFTSKAGPYKGLFFKDADKVIIKDLIKRGLMFKNTKLEHSYPFCWRTDAPLMYRAVPSWFLNVEKIKSKLLEHNQDINWQPAHIKNGRMGKWLENARDWAISRNRFWGTTIPVWVCQNCHETLSFGSIKDLEKKSGQVIKDLHRHFVDDIVLDCDKCEGKMKRTPEVLDCWFESGSMPYGQEHYPFENRQKFETSFPADFISEGLDQTRGWFYTLMVLSAALFEKPAFKNCVVSGLVLAENGQKMSKRLKNYPPPGKIIDKYGADTIRLYMLNSGAIKAEELKFSEQGLIEILRGYMLPLWNVLKFFTTYANLDGWQASNKEVSNELSKLENPLDIWIISRLESLIDQVTTALESYKLGEAIEPILKFINELTNWYLRRSRRRFWKSDISTDKNQAYTTIYHTLMTLTKLLAPIVPFLSETIYQVLKTKQDPASVHFCDYPHFAVKRQNIKLESAMAVAIKVCRLGRTLRTRQNIKIRQALQSLTIVSTEPEIAEYLPIIKPFIIEELNIKQLLIAKNEVGLVNYSARPNLPVLGKKYAKLTPLIKEALAKVASADLAKLAQKEGVLNLTIKGDKGLVNVPLELSDILLDRYEKEGSFSLSEQNMTILMDFHITKDLKYEGLGREFLNRIQTARKELDLAVEDKINVIFWASDDFHDAIVKHSKYIMEESLSQKLEFSEHNLDRSPLLEIDDYKLKFSITKVK
ncbi:MAG: isoleucine--tRNA ligase [SAR324 cluster bacterium]|nr:isoleucine--tRNA ligase [SAR324 cluster bacterium]